MINGHPHDPIALGRLLGMIEATSSRQTEIILRTYEETRALRLDLAALPDRIAARLPSPSSAPASTGSPTSTATAADRWRRTADTITTIMQALVPIGLIIALVIGKLSHPEFLPLLREALGAR